jgi:hypothetical protein
VRLFATPEISDGRGDHQLVGLTAAETREFELLERLPPLDGDGVHIAWSADGQPPTTRERRWLELYQKHDRARQNQRILATGPTHADSAIPAIFSDGPAESFSWPSPTALL